MEDAYPNPPDDVPKGSSFVFSKDSTGHLAARFRVGDTVYRNVAECSLRHPLGTVHLMNRLVGRLDQEPFLTSYAPAGNGLSAVSLRLLA